MDMTCRQHYDASMHNGTWAGRMIGSPSTRTGLLSLKVYTDWRHTEDTTRENGMTGIRRLAIVLATVAISGMVANIQAQEVYRWVDDEGITHYSSTPPPDRDTDTIDASNPPADDPEASRKEIEKLRQSNKTRLYKKRLERQAAADEREQQRELERFCTGLRDKRQTLVTSPQVREHTEDGARMMSQAEREAKLREFDQQLAEHCGGV